MITIKIDNKEMIHNVINVYNDMLCDAAISGDPNRVSDYCRALCDTLKPLSREDDMEGIRKLFKDGMTSMLLGSKFESIDRNEKVWGDEVEVRVYKDDKLLGVVIDSEIC
jgi:hypothetical protein